MNKWIKNGIRLAWLVAISEQKTLVYRPDKAMESKGFTEKLCGEDVLLGFEMVVADILEL